MGKTKKKAPQVHTRPITREDAENLADTFIDAIAGNNLLIDVFNGIEPKIVDIDHVPDEMHEEELWNRADKVDEIESRVMKAARPVLVDAFYREGNAVLGFQVDDDAPPFTEVANDDRRR